MRRDYYVQTSEGGFWVSITEFLAGGELVGIVAGCVALIVAYLLFGTPFIIWPLLLDEFRDMFESDVPFWSLVGVQIACALWRIVALRAKGEASFAKELLLQGLVFFVAFEAVQCVGFYHAVQQVDPQLLAEYGITDLSFWGLVRQHVTVTYDSLGMVVGTLYVSYTAAFLPAAACCLASRALRS